jgi:hypothetical protein
MKSTAVVVLLFTLGSASAFIVAPSKAFHATSKLFSSETEDVIVSPFEEGGPSDGADEGPLDLTWDNVEMVLDEMRPYLIQDGGNVAIKEIDGPVVRLELQVSVVSSYCIPIQSTTRLNAAIHPPALPHFYIHS